MIFCSESDPGQKAACKHAILTHAPAAPSPNLCSSINHAATIVPSTSASPAPSPSTPPPPAPPATPPAAGPSLPAAPPAPHPAPARVHAARSRETPPRLCRPPVPGTPPPTPCAQPHRASCPASLLLSAQSWPAGRGAVVGNRRSLPWMRTLKLPFAGMASLEWCEPL